MGSCLSKEYAENLFRLLVTYESISASEAASRLGLHIKTVQDFLEALAEVEILGKEEGGDITAQWIGPDDEGREQVDLRGRSWGR